MIRRLTVRDYLIFGNVSLELHGGFNVISGETGAGKSLIVDAISLLTGGRVDWEAVPRRAYLEMVVRGDGEMERALLDLGVPYDGEVVIRRTLNPSNRRSRIFLNDMQVSAATVRKILRGRIFVGSQFSQTEIDDPHLQTEAYDRFTGIDLGDYPRIYEEYRAKLSALRRLEGRLSELKTKEDYLRFQLNEIKKLDLREGEEEELRRRREELEGLIRAQEWSRYFREVYPILREHLSALLRGAPEQFRERLDAVVGILEDVSLEVPEELEDLGEEFDRINARLYEIDRLKSRFRTDFVGLLSLERRLEEEIDSISRLEGEVERLRREISSLEGELQRLSKAIDDRRKEFLRDFSNYIAENLRALGFEYVEVETRLEPTGFHSRGGSFVRVLVSTVPGIPPHPVSQLSGGELARVALVLFSTGASHFRTLILDEVDAGVSPSVADRIGKLLKELSRSVQIVSITHQAFTALHADRHFTVERVSPSLAEVREVEGEDRWRELARMMGVEDPEMARTTLRGT